MKALQILVLFFLLLSGAAVLMAQAPNWNWAHGAGGNESDYGRSIATDSQGNQ
ncbi:MAG TPA: hypothetical protein PLM99_04325 [Candidatus Cloacimonadota bacterium]|jgi:hypothetical protein|nr:hypothetical protein [Candidatus Cloacimonadota bacterium]HOR59234.1 hypothetical protein [Candidatus Cloacimonadota bacterium]HPL23463.1 hypothetical protein [Candidatus Cloacimonadota bacterium]HRS50218.1 hypothetical protein [Candidatus Cloacimonadota bacterium]